MQIGTTIDLIVHTSVAGFGLSTAGAILWLLKNRELSEAVAALKRHFVDAPQVVVEPSVLS